MAVVEPTDGRKRNHDDAFSTASIQGVPPPLFREISPDHVVARTGRLDKNNNVNVSLFNVTTQQLLTSILAIPPGEPCFTEWGLETSSPQNVPNFVQGKASAKPEKFDISLQLSPEQVTFIETLESKVKTLAKENSKEWFGKVMPENVLDSTFHSSLKRPMLSEQGESARLKVGVLLGAPPEQQRLLTRINLVCGSDVESGSGWEWLSPRLDRGNRWRNSKIWPTIDMKSIWIVKGKGYGVRYTMREIIVCETTNAVQKHGLAFTPSVIDALVQRLANSGRRETSEPKTLEDSEGSASVADDVDMAVLL
jgi:hypothetical protein